MKENRIITCSTLLMMLALLCTPLFSYANSETPVGSIIVDSITHVQPRCGLDNGSVTVYAQGSEHIFYSIDNGLTFQEDSIFVDLGIGDYAIMVTDGLACIQPYTVQLTNGPQVRVDNVNVTCHEQNVSADIEIDVENGIPPFTYMWDGPGNYASTSQNLFDVSPGNYRVTITDDVGCTTIEDVEIPICCGLSQGLNLSCPADLYLGCGNPNNDQLINDWLQSAYGTDGLNNTLIVDNNYNISNNVFCQDVVTVRFITRDQCDNETFCTADILIADINLPTIQCPSDVTLDFIPGQNLDNIEEWLATATASDNCSGAFVDNNFDPLTTSFLCDSESNFTVNFVAIDQCSNTDNCEATITISQAPEVNLVCLNNLEVQCNQLNIDQVITEWISKVKAEDTNGNTIPVEHDFEFQPSYNCGDVFEINFISYNHCGDPLNCNGYISIVDSEAPTMNCDNHLDLSAYANDKVEQIEDWLSSIEAVDNCSSAEVSNNFDPSSLNYGCGEAGTIVVKFEAVDECDNKEICLLSINIIANDMSIDVPAPMEIYCSTNNLIEIQTWLNEARAVNQYGQEFDVNNNLDPMAISCIEPTQVQFSYTNACGDMIEASSSIILHDIEAPMISCPQEFSIMSFELPNFDFDAWLNEFTADDVCSNVMIENDFNYAEFDGSCIENQVVRFTAEDQCGNVTECFVQVKIADYALPEVECPDDLYIDTADPFAQEELLDHIDKIYHNTNSTLNVEYSVDVDFDRIHLLQESVDVEVEVKATNECNEVDYCSFLIHINSEAQVFAPSIFSPNGDGENDRFTIFGNNHLVSIIHLSIYDRLGNRIEYLTDLPINHPSLGWDGTFRGRPCEIGVYAYHALIEDLKGNEIELVGSITLVR